jgi:hypothetical protein
MNTSGIKKRTDAMRLEAAASFVAKAVAVHGNRYDYGNSLYVDCSTPLSIRCAKHGDFLQTPSSHFRGRGCPSCGKDRISQFSKNSKLITSVAKHQYQPTYTSESWLEKAKSLHPHYDYSDSAYTSWRTRVAVRCIVHGVFHVFPSKHVAKTKRGCPGCALSKSHETIEALKLVQSTYYGKYRAKQGARATRFGLVPYRSSYEEAFVKKCEEDPDVTMLHAEPMTVLMGKKRYKPDFAVDRLSGVREIVEIKPRSFLDAPGNRAKFAAATELCNLYGMSFLVLTEENVF